MKTSNRVLSPAAHGRSAFALIAIIVAALSHLSHASDAAAERVAKVSIGGRELTIPMPDGFDRYDGINPEVDKLFAAALPPSNRMLVNLAPNENVQELRSGTVPALSRSLNLQIVRELGSRDIGLSDFAGVRAEMRRELKKMEATIAEEIRKHSKKGSEKMKGATGTDVVFDITDTAMLGVFEDTDASLGFTMGMKVNAGAGTDVTDTRMVVSAIMTPVNGRLINVYANGDFRTEADRQWAEQAVKAWRDQIVGANPRMEAGEGFAKRFDWGKVMAAGAKGAAIGALVWLVRSILRRSTRRRSQPPPLPPMN